MYLYQYKMSESKGSSAKRIFAKVADPAYVSHAYRLLSIRQHRRCLQWVTLSGTHFFPVGHTSVFRTLRSRREDHVCCAGIKSYKFKHNRSFALDTTARSLSMFRWTKVDSWS